MQQGPNASLQPFVHFDLKRLFLLPEDRPPLETPAPETVAAPAETPEAPVATGGESPAAPGS